MAEKMWIVSSVFLVFVIFGTQVLPSSSKPLPRTAEDDVESDPAATITPEILSDINKFLSDKSYLKSENLEDSDKTETTKRSEGEIPMYVEKRSLDTEADENQSSTPTESYEEDNFTEDSSETTTQNPEDEAYINIEPIRLKRSVDTEKSSEKDDSSEDSSEYPVSILARSKRENNQDVFLDNQDSGKDGYQPEQKQRSKIDKEGLDIVKYGSRDKRSAPQNKNGIDLG